MFNYCVSLKNIYNESLYIKQAERLCISATREKASTDLPAFCLIN